MTTTKTETRTIKVPTSGGWGLYEVTIPGPFADVSDVRAANKNAGQHYFDKDAMRFFRSRPSRNTLRGRFFIDSIQFVPSNGQPYPREYKLCLVTDDGHIHTVAAPPAEWDGQPRTDTQNGNWRDKFTCAEDCKDLLSRLLETL